MSFIKTALNTQGAGTQVSAKRVKTETDDTQDFQDNNYLQPPQHLINASSVQYNVLTLASDRKRWLSDFMLRASNNKTEARNTFFYRPNEISHELDVLCHKRVIPNPVLRQRIEKNESLRVKNGPFTNYIDSYNFLLPPFRGYKSDRSTLNRRI